MTDSTRRQILGVCTCLVLLGGAAYSWAGKPVPPPPPPLPGTVYFIYDTNPQVLNLQGNVLQMNADGSAKAASPIVPPWEQFDGDGIVPSTKRYGTDNRRWWLVVLSSSDTVYRPDIYATKDGVNLIKIAETVVRDNLDGTATGLYFEGKVVWSNNDQDSCIFVAARRYVKDLATNTNIRHEYLLYRIDISAPDIQASAGNIVPVTDGDPRLVPLAVYQVPQGISAAYFGLGQFALAPSPDGNRFVIDFHDDSSSYPDLYLLDVTNGPVFFQAAALPVFQHDAYSIPEQVKWSPPSAASSRIVFQSGTILRTMNPDGTGMKTLVSSGGSWPCWSPDGSYLVYTQGTKKGNVSQYNIVRIPAAGGTAVNLTSDLDATFVKLAVGWLP